MSASIRGVDVVNKHVIHLSNSSIMMLEEVAHCESIAGGW